MSAEQDITLDEKRVYSDARQEAVAYVGSSLGVARVTVSGDQIGRFSLAERCEVRDVAGADGKLLVATAEDVLVGTSPTDGEGGSGDGEDNGDAGAVAFESAGFGPAAAVGLADGTPVAAGADGRIARLDGDHWQTLDVLEDVRAIDGPYLATADGVLVVTADDVENLGLADVRDVAARGPHVAASNGLFRAGEGWETELIGEFDVIGVGEETAHAVDGDDGLWVRREGEWGETALPVEEPVVGIAYGECPYAVTVDGTFLVEAGEDVTPDGSSGWRSRALGIRDVVGVAVP